MFRDRITFTAGEVAEYYRARLPKLLQRGRQWRGPCPLHQGKRPSFSVHAETGRWHCFADCGRGGSMIDFEMTITGADFKTALAALYAIVGRPMPAKARMTREEWTAAMVARERGERERSEAEHFAGAAVLLLEDELERLPVESRERRLWTHVLATLRADPLNIYRLYRARDEKSADDLVSAGREHELRVHLRLAELIMEMASDEDSDAA